MRFLYSEEGQKIAGRHYYRPRLAAVAEIYAPAFPKLTLFTIQDVCGGWKAAQKMHFDDGAIFDQISAKK